MGRREVMYNPSVLSYTALSDYMRCPKYFEYIYVLKKERIMNQALTRGLTVHKKCEELCEADEPAKVEEILKGWPAEDIDRGLRYAEYFTDKHIVTLTNSKGQQLKGIEYYDLLPIKRGLKFEYHIDNVHYCKDGTLRIMDIKTGLLVPSREQLEEDLQLQLYAWALLKSLHDKGGIVPARVQVGWWFWYHKYNIFVEYEFKPDMEDRLIKLSDEIKDAKKAQDFPRCANKFCPGCPMFPDCHPQEVAETYKECKDLAEFWKGKADQKKVEVFNKLSLIGTEKLEDKDKRVMYQVMNKNFTYPEYDDLFNKIIEGVDTSDPKALKEALRPFIKVSKETLKEHGLEVNMLPGKTTSELRCLPIL